LSTGLDGGEISAAPRLAQMPEVQANDHLTGPAVSVCFGARRRHESETCDHREVFRTDPILDGRGWDFGFRTRYVARISTQFFF
jgi:hypothetical protein